MDVSVLLVIIQSTFVALELLHRIISISMVKGLKLTCMNESGPVLLMP